MYKQTGMQNTRKGHVRTHTDTRTQNRIHVIRARAIQKIGVCDADEKAEHRYATQKKGRKLEKEQQTRFERSKSGARTLRKSKSAKVRGEARWPGRRARWPGRQEKSSRLGAEVRGRDPR
eukprot:5142240-Pleurochrysis_carterae.AAC.2